MTLDDRIADRDRLIREFMDLNSEHRAFAFEEMRAFMLADKERDAYRSSGGWLPQYHPLFWAQRREGLMRAWRGVVAEDLDVRRA